MIGEKYTCFHSSHRYSGYGMFTSCWSIRFMPSFSNAFRNHACSIVEVAVEQCHIHFLVPGNVCMNSTVATYFTYGVLSLHLLISIII